MQPKLKAGDVIGFSSCSHCGVLINLATWGVPFVGLSHVAILAEVPGYSKPLLFESTSLLQEPCLIRGVVTSGVQAHRPIPRIVGYRGKVWCYPLAETLDANSSRRLTEFCLDSWEKATMSSVHSDPARRVLDGWSADCAQRI